MANPNNFSPPGSGLVWFGLPKCASSSQKKAVALSFGLLTPEECAKKGLPLKLVNSRLDILTPAEVRDRGMCSFAFVRNPFDRFVSLWNERVRPRAAGVADKQGFPGGLSLEAFAEWLCERDPQDVNHHARSLTSKIWDDGVLVPTHIFRFEDLAADWRRCQGIVMDAAGVALQDLDHLRNGKRHDHYRELYTPRCRGLITTYFQQDLDFLGYEF